MGRFVVGEEIRAPGVITSESAQGGLYMNRSVVQAVLWTLVGSAATTAFFLLGPFSSRLGVRDITPTLRSYAAPEQMDEAMTGALSHALEGHGRVTTAPNGQLLITAPAFIQDQIPKIMATVAANAERPKLVRIEAWSVVTAADGGQSLEDPVFEEIRPALVEIAKSNPGVRFQLDGRVSLEVVSGSAGKNQSLEVRPRLRKREDGKQVIAADLNMGTVKTHVQLVPGELAVIGFHTEQDLGAKFKLIKQTRYNIVRGSL